MDALTCPYCKADLIHTLVPEGPQWPGRNEDEELPPAAASAKQKLPLRSKIILVTGLLLFALGVYMVGGNRERNDFADVLQEKEQEARDKDDKIKALESELVQLRKQSQSSANELAEAKSKAAVSEKELTAARVRLREANQEIDRLSSRLASARPARNAEPPPAAATNSAARTRRSAAPRLYETTRATPVYEEPASSARVMSQIAKGTRITVVRAAGEWLEIRSKHGNPSGYIRSDDAASLGRAE